MQIALTIATGRPRVRKVLKAFLANAIQHGYDPKQFSIYLSIDTQFQQSKREDFILDPLLEGEVKKVQYIFEEDRKKLAEELAKTTGEDKKLLIRLFSAKGYSPQRNSALLTALLDKNDVAICIDDDEAPFIPIKTAKGMTWKNPNFFAPHLEALSSGADITRGPYLGYKSPIPSDFEKDVPEEIRVKLGEALQLGNDVITKDTFMNLFNDIKILSEEELYKSERPFLVEHGPLGKHVYAGNMGINLHSVREGKIPLFYTPPSARGEDTIFALQLHEVVMKEVPSYIFHDPFNLYPEVFEGKFPERLEPIPVTESSKIRFADALLGWLKYAPILVLMTSKTRKEQEKKIGRMIEKIKEPTEQLAEIFQLPSIKKSQSLLQEYQHNVQEHYSDLVEAQRIWRKVVPLIEKEELEVSYAR